MYLEKIVLGLVVLIGAGLVYSHIAVSRQLRVLNERTDQCCYPAGSIGEALRAELEHFGTKTEAAESYRAQLIREALSEGQQDAEIQLSYLEFLVEGLARREKIPIERARARLARELDVPENWTWPSDWEREPAEMESVPEQPEGDSDEEDRVKQRPQKRRSPP